MIRIKDVEKVFFSRKRPKVTAVSNINLEINEGEIFGIIGYSGAGKSTLLRMINQLEKPTNGSVSIGDHDLTTFRGKKLRQARQNIGMIFQHFNLLWSRTAAENISLPLEVANVPKEERKKRVKELINLVGLQGKEDAYPSQLSGGQKQRVGIARALANNPSILLCDEATSALDPKTTDAILDLLLDINKRLGLTIVLITHEFDVIRKICHEVAVMENGNIVEQGKVQQIFQQPKHQATKSFVSPVELEAVSK
jgi:D-methionine transport system ATP-binding protein